MKIGATYGDWTVVSEAPRRNYQRYMRCRCICGKTKEVFAHNLTVGKSQGCGCRRDTETAKRNLRHGRSNTPEYRAWAGARNRCLNPNLKSYKHYGGRGITIDPAWLHDFAQFYSDMGPCPRGKTLERKDNDGPYSKSNCRWATRFEQMQNFRRNRFLECNGELLTVSEWARRLQINTTSLCERLANGWSIERALTEPMRPDKRRAHS